MFVVSNRCHGFIERKSGQPQLCRGVTIVDISAGMVAQIQAQLNKQPKVCLCLKRYPKTSGIIQDFLESLIQAEQHY